MIKQDKYNHINDFVQYCQDKLKIKHLPAIKFSSDKNWAIENTSFGAYNPGLKSLVVYVNNRNLADILRTIAHELVHHKQLELGNLKSDSGDTGSDIENQANSIAGVLMRNYGKTNDLIYEGINPPQQYTIYCDMDGVLCDFDQQFFRYLNITPTEFVNQTGRDSFTDAIDSVGIEYWSQMPWMPGAQQLWSMISSYKPSLLTSPGKFKYAIPGKKIWVRDNLNPLPQDIIFSSVRQKQVGILDRPGVDTKAQILIDDYSPNIKPWLSAGGTGILSKSTSDAIQQLKQLGL